MQRCRISLSIKQGQEDINEFWGMLQAVGESYLYTEITDGREWRRMRQTLISDAISEKRQWAQIETQSYIWIEQNPFCTIWVAKHKLPIEIGRSASADILQTQLGNVLDNLWELMLLQQQAWTRRSPEVSQNLNHSVLLYWRDRRTKIPLL